MYFICGIHGVGKTTYARQLSKSLGLKYFSAGELIGTQDEASNGKYKSVNSIIRNQQKLLQKLANISDQHFILDGHLCLINEKKEIERIDQAIFRCLEIERLYIVIDKIINISRNLENRDHMSLDLNYLENFQFQEIEYACELSKELQVPLKFIYNSKEIISSAIVSSGNIILPIKPIYTEMILNHKKKYEYRKNLCKKEIKKIYIYETSPIKKIIGEANVTEKILMEKEKLWDLSQKEAGISKEQFLHYFHAQDYACAYHLAKIKRYEKPLELEKLGIEYAPQSYLYIGDI